MMLPLAVTQVLEKAVEAVLRMDPETRARLASIDAQVVRINCRNPSICVMLAIVDGKVLLSNPDDTVGIDPSVDTTISGELSALRSLVSGNDAIYTGKVAIEGDIGTSQQIKHIIANLDPNWQDAVAPYLGDGLTHRLDVAQSRVRNWVLRTHEGAQRNTSDYLQEEIELLAPNSEVQQFCNDVDEVRAAADRLAARIQQQEAIHNQSGVKD